MLKPLLRRLRNLVLGPAPRAILSPASRIIGIDQATYAPTARLYVRKNAAGSFGHMLLGLGVYIGRNVELATALGGDMQIGEGSSIQDNCVFHGDISIGSHCLFAANVLMSTTIHRFRDHPHRLIRDQDAAVAACAPRPADYSCPIVIGDDCWIGWGVAIMPGVYVGRGAIVGANCVLTRDVGPYEIHGGVPNRLLGKRLDFLPPRALSSASDADNPYFYSGFRLRQAELQENRAIGIRAGLAHAIIVLAGGAKRIRIEGLVLDPARPLRLELRINGAPAGIHQVIAGLFGLECQTEGAPVYPVPAPLSSYTVLELIDPDHISGCAKYGSYGRYTVQSVTIL